MARRRYPFLETRIFGEPLAIEPRKLHAILVAVGPRLGLSEASLATSRQESMDVPSKASRSRVDLQVQDGIAVIDVFGPLVHRNAGDFASGGPTSYSEISDELQAALADDSVKSILLVVDSPGGEVAGAFDLADEIYAARAKKPITAIAADLAASAGYLIASSASRLLVTQTALVGSIGVVSTHVDLSAAEAMNGIRVTLIHAGDRKVDGNPHAPLTDDAKGAMKARVASAMDLFVSAVARNRGMTQTAIRDTEAGLFDPAEAEKLGLIDGVIASSAVLDAVQEELGADLSMHLKSRQPAIVVGGGPNAPATSRETENPMEKKPIPALADAVAGAEVIDLAAENEKLKKELAKQTAITEAAQAAVKASVEAKKVSIIDAHVKRGAIAPAMLPSIQKLAAVMDSAEELDKHLATFATVIHKASDVRTESGDPGAPGTLPPRTGKNDLVTDWRDAARRFGNLSTAEKYGRVVSVRQRDRVAVLDDGSEVSLDALKGGRA